MYRGYINTVFQWSRVYYFLSKDEFKSKLTDGAFLDWEEVYTNQFYGTLQSEVDRIWSLQKHIILDVDVNGAKTIKEIYGERCFAIFVKPPSIQTLINRLRARDTESSESLRKRIGRIKKELSYENSFDVILINNLLEVALKEAEVMVNEFLVS